MATYTAGIGLPLPLLLGFGTQFFDADLDGDLDLFVANSHVLDNIALIDQSNSYGQCNLLFRNDVSARASTAFDQLRVGRGSAAGDYDLEGYNDLLVFNSGQPLSLLRNDRCDANCWITMRLQGKQGNPPNGIGAGLTAYNGIAEADRAIRNIDAAATLCQTRKMRGSRSYLSQNPLSISFGLGTYNRLDRLEVRWPSGRTE